MQFRKKPVVIDAIQWNGDNDIPIMDFVGKKLSVSKPSERIEMDNDLPNHAWVLIIPTLEGDMRANRNDWIIKGVNGEFYPCKPDIFEKTYESESTTSVSPVEWEQELENESTDFAEWLVDNDYTQAFLTVTFKTLYREYKRLPSPPNQLKGE